MTISNITSGFRVTGIYPVDREAVLGSCFDPSTILDESGLAYIPSISPVARHTASHILSRPTDEKKFSDEEITQFEYYWYDNDCNIDDDRYNSWLAQCHPTSPAASHVWMQPLQSTGITKFPSSPSKIPILLNPSLAGEF